MLVDPECCVFVGLPLPHRLRFGVKFYAADPCKLFEEITRFVAGKTLFFADYTTVRKYVIALHWW